MAGVNWRSIRIVDTELYQYFNTAVNGGVTATVKIYFLRKFHEINLANQKTRFDLLNFTFPQKTRHIIFKIIFKK